MSTQLKPVKKKMSRTTRLDTDIDMEMDVQSTRAKYTDSARHIKHDALLPDAP